MDIHVVRAGETVSSVAARYGVPAGILAGVNGIAPDAPLAVGQTLVVRHPRELHTVAIGESVYSIALHYGLSVRTLYQNNPALGGRSALYPGQTLVIAYDDTPTRTLAVNAYSYPFIRGGLLDAALPYLTYLTPFTYGITADQVTSSASFNATVGTAFPDEIVMVEATDAAAAQDVASKLTNRLSAIADQAASYDPDSEALAKKCEVVTSGNYVGMFFSSHYDEMVSAFQNAVG